MSCPLLQSPPLSPLPSHLPGYEQARTRVPCSPQSRPPASSFPALSQDQARSSDADEEDQARTANWPTLPASDPQSSLSFSTSSPDSTHSQRGGSLSSSCVIHRRFANCAGSVPLFGRDLRYSSPEASLYIQSLRLDTV